MDMYLSLTNLSKVIKVKESVTHLLHILKLNKHTILNINIFIIFKIIYILIFEDRIHFFTSRFSMLKLI